MSDLFYGVVTGLAIGAMGSFHCIGMCGPLALSLPVHSFSKSGRWLAIGLYNFGRAVTYSCIGLLFGLLGMPFRLWGVQQVVSILCGVVLLVFVFSHFKVRIPSRRVEGMLTRLRSAMQYAIQSARTSGSFFAIGLLNGLLPCGLVYVAIVAAFAVSHVWMGGVLMFSFGIGTMPAMAGLMLLGHRISIRHRQRIQRAVPYVISVMACLLILRGLNLGIPFVSPKMGDSVKEVPTCHGNEEVEIFPVPR